MLSRLRRTAALFRPRALARQAELPQQHERLLQRVDALTAEVRSLASQLEAMSLNERQLRAIMRADADADEKILKFQTTLDEARLARHVQKSVARATLHVDPFP